MRILITGATGFVGKQLVKSLGEHQLIILTRNVSNGKSLLGSHHQYWQTLADKPDLNDIDAVINLAGEPIVNKRWSNKQKKLICDSRWDITSALTQLIRKSTNPPHTFISASAIGYYGRQGNTPIDETSGFNAEFSHDICQEWENIALQAQSQHTRVCITRIGIVLGKNGGALAKMLPPFKLGLGGPIGNGEQGMSWIHIDDLIRLLCYLLSNPNLKGIYNATAPQPVSNAEFAKALGSALNRPAKITTPPLALRLAMGEMSELLTTGQFVLPKRTLAAGFGFQYRDINSALQQVIN
ncbi:TIGR01777 family protein [Shewanella sp. Actino-trap-3]|uniref:TIGR01777 family oxidoreductase n=1 Tax=Shewanella sp. Actino-trap-3 TaxID=2058331 RepID=UPI000C33483E|nr:TIGR01777 family oxidoreductase [Shewanella sp. Actino-trap-3]PKG77049.1 TIGR01777 family protein [Shewanella sp. Actino-trap-3]|tara:strand:- start:109257 stop:110147 length:891 start_codon:yes stop_codon:yes gene_type:complete